MASLAIGLPERAHGRLTSAGVAVATLTIVAGTLRFVSLGAKGFWQDEAYTALLLNHGFARTLSLLPTVESSPPLYYALAWGWTRLFGISEVGLRSLSALCGTAVVPVTYLAASALRLRRSALLAAALVAVNPALFWFSQDARSNALLILMAAVSLLFLARSLERRRGALGWWALAAALTVGTHYFGAFLVAGEALWLLWARRDEWRRVALAVAAPAATASALVPLSVAQATPANTAWIRSISLASRIVEVPPALVVGFQAPALVAVGGAGCALAAYGVWLLLRRAGPEPRGGCVALSIAALSILIPLILALAGLDYFYYRNVIGAAVPLLVALAAGYAATTSGRAAAAALVLLSLAIVLATAWQPVFNREDWRSAVRSLGSARDERALVVTPVAGEQPLEWYADARRAPARGVRVRVVDVIGVARNRLGALTGAHTPRPKTVSAPSGFVLVERHDGAKYTTLRFVASRAMTLDSQQLAAARIDATPAVVLVSPSSRGG